jgi:phage baseplate assembly protein W
MSTITDQIIMQNGQNSKVQQIAMNKNNEQIVYVYSDLNVRDPLVSTSTAVMLYDTKTIVQGVWRLLTTEEGEIPNFRNYGLDIKRFSQYPLTSKTVDAIYNYVKDRVEAFETRAEIIRANVDVDFEQGVIYMVFFLRMRASGEVVQLPIFNVQVSSS